MGVDEFAQECIEYGVSKKSFADEVAFHKKECLALGNPSFTIYVAKAVSYCSD